MSTRKSEAEGRIYQHVQREAYLAGIIPLQAMVSTPRSLLLPGREENWLRSITTRVARHWIKKGLPDLTVVTRLHPPINDIANKQLGTKGSQGMSSQEYAKHAKKIVQEWKKEGRPRPNKQKVGNTTINVVKKNEYLMIRAFVIHGSIQFVVESGWLTFEDYESQLRFPEESLSEKHRNPKPLGRPKKNRISRILDQ